MQLTYCSRCDKQIRADLGGNADYYLIDKEPVCPRCFKKLSPEEQKTATDGSVSGAYPEAANTPDTRVLPVARRPSTRMLPAHRRTPVNVELPPDLAVPEADVKPRGDRKAVVAIVAALVILAVGVPAAYFLTRGGTLEPSHVTDPESTPEPNPEPTPEPAPEPNPEPAPEPTPEPIPEPVPGKELVLVADADAHLYSQPSRRDMNYGSNPNLKVRSSTKAYLRFDLSGVEEPIKAARISLSIMKGRSSVAGMTVEVWPVADDAWDEMKITWNQCPPAGDKPVATYAPPPEDPSEFDVTEYVKAALASGRKKISMCLTMSEPENSKLHARYFSRESTSQERRPRLIVTRAE